MPIKTLAAALALIAGLTPGMTLAQGCSHDRQANVSCGEGHSWDREQMKCVPISS